MEKLKPRLFSVMKIYTKEQFVKDVVAGIIVAGIVAQHDMDELVGEENFCSHIDEALARAEALYPEENQ